MIININKNIGIFLIIIENWLSELYKFISFNNNKYFRFIPSDNNKNENIMLNIDLYHIKIKWFN